MVAVVVVVVLVVVLAVTENIASDPYPQESTLVAAGSPDRIGIRWEMKIITVLKIYK